MPTTAKKTIELLSSGQNVRQLQKSLIATGAVISEKEMSRGIFGRSTQAAIKKFQASHGIRATGIADTRTLALLNPETPEDRLRKGDFSSVVRSATTRRLIRKIEKIDLSQSVFSEDGSEISDALKTWKQGRLKQQIINTFETPSEILITSVNALALDVDRVGNQEFSSLLSNTVLPALLKDENLESEVFNFIQSKKLDSSKSDSSGSTVAEMLDLEGDIRDVPELKPFVNTIRNTVFGGIVRLRSRVVTQLGDTDLLEDGAAIIELEKEGVITVEEKKSLLLVTDLARLTDDNFKAIRALTLDGVADSRDLVTRNQSDWLHFIEANQIDPPEAETPESYAKILDCGVENAFPTAYALSRYTAAAPSEIINAVPVLDDIPETSDPVFVNGEVRKDLDLSRLPTERIDSIRQSLEQLAQFSNRYSGLGITEVLNDQGMPTQEKLQVINRRQTALNQAWTLYPDLDLKYANFLPSSDKTAEAFRVDLDSIAENERPHVRRALMSVQRVFQLSDSFDDVDKLMAVGLDSATKIADIDDVDELVFKTGLKHRVAAELMQRASLVRTHMVHFVHSVEATAGHAAFNPQILNESAPGSNTDLINVLKDLPGYSELFGPQNYCKCVHCQSIFSPAAYLVDLMGFIHKKISKPNFINQDREAHPLYLRNRRPDLWTLPLTCENTNNTLIYLSIVNEVLENYLSTQGVVDGDVWEFLANDARSSFRQPFNLPHAQLLLYLEHLGVSLQEVSSVFSDDNSPSVHSVLGISPQELTTLSIVETDAVHMRFAAALSEHNTATLAKLADVDRSLLERLWSAEFVSGNVELSVEVASASDDLVGFEEHLRLSVPEGTDSDAGSRHFLERLHRFVRLQRALAWTPEEIQLVIDTLRPLIILTSSTAPSVFSEILNTTLLTNIAEFKNIKDALALSVAETLALCQRIPTASVSPDTPSLWFQLFGDKIQLEIRHPQLDNTTVADPTVTSDFGVLQGALRLAEPELIALLSREITDTTLATGILLEEDLHRLYRFARFARALDLSQEQFLVVAQIFPAFGAAVNVAERLAATSEIVLWLKQLEHFSLDLGNILEILRDEAIDSYAQQAESLLPNIQEALNDEEKRWLTPKDFSSIEGISAEASRVIIREFESLDPPWLVRPDSTVERYFITDAVAGVPDVLVIQDFLFVAGGPLTNGDDTDHAIAFLSKAISQELAKHHPSALVRLSIAQALSISDEYERAFEPLLSHLQGLSDTESHITNWIQDGSQPIPESLINYASEVIRLSHLFKDSLSLKPAAIAFITQNEPLFSLPVGQRWQWPELFNLLSFQTFSKKSKEKFSAYKHALLSWNGMEFPVIANVDLAIISDINNIQVHALLSEIPQNNSPFVTLQKLGEAVRLSKRTGLDPAALRQLTSTSFEGLSAGADLLFGAMRTKYPDEDVWHSVEAPFFEKTEGLKRDALVDRILSRPELRFDNGRDIYHFFLLDPEMDGCFLTSRVKNAISSCQLYVQRCLMGLEQQDPNTAEAFRVIVKNDKKSREEWKWRKSYRVWEANRKVFLYPENYMLPDLRDDRSHIFKIAEHDLLQGKLDDDSIDQLYKRYITEFVQVGNLEIVHALHEPSKKTYLLFGRTKQEPLRYFMREFDGRKRWEPWQAIDLDISARTISAVRKKGKLYIFWTNVDLNADADKIKEANSVQIPSQSYSPEQVDELMPIGVVYSYLNESGNWSSPQDILYYNLLLMRNDQEVYRLLPFSDRIYVEYPHPSGGGSGGVTDFIRLIHPVGVLSEEVQNSYNYLLRPHLGFLRESDNKTVRRSGNDTSARGDKGDLDKWISYVTTGYKTYENQIKKVDKTISESTADVDYIINNLDDRFFYNDFTNETGIAILEFSNVDEKRISLRCVHRKTTEAILNLGDIQYLIKKTGRPGYSNPSPENFLAFLVALKEAERKLISLDSGWAEYLSKRIYSKGVSGLLASASQTRNEPRSSSNIDYRWVGQIKGTDEDFLTSHEHMLAQFNGPHGDYLWEIFFHLPVLIAHTFNSQGKFEAADRWYRYVFDPTTSTEKPKDHWRFVVFRSLEIPKLREILTQTSAINTYKKDPFNPYAIARLRPTAFEKNLLMRYIDNLIDWGDSLFGRDTRESISEALLLYVMAADLLGERPIETGECEVADSMTYSDIVLRNRGGEFLVELENFMAYFVNINRLPPIDPDPEILGFAHFTPPEGEPENELPNSFSVGGGFSVINSSELNFNNFSITRAVVARSLLVDEGGTDTIPTIGDVIAIEPVAPDPDPPFEPDFPYAIDEEDTPDPGGPVQIARTLGFCVPPNETLLGYWDRVDDRLYKLRHCMNIDGVERQLPLWQPPIDPMLLVRAKAAGLSLDEVIASISEQPPFQRFEVLLDRARKFTATTQQLGNQLLSALERKDENELVFLRAVQEDEILSLSRDQKKASIEEAQKVLNHLDKLEESITLRKNYYSDLLGIQTDLMMNAEELDALAQMGEAKGRQDRAGEAESKAQRYRELGPQWSAGVSGSAGVALEMVEVLGVPTPISAPILRGTVDASASWGSVNIEARFQRRAFRHRDASGKHSALAGMASTKGSYKRRIEEWQLQQNIAQSEIDALVPQKAAADIRIALAEKELEVHDAQTKNSRELYDFAKDRFTGLGLYTYLSTSLSRLHREAYDMAFKMAQVAERAYHFELGDHKYFIKMNNWKTSRAGLLSGDHLMLQLQAMEASFVEKDKRRQEITLPCSLLQIDPHALTSLRQTGGAEFVVPQWWFDLHYPGQYRRLLQSVRLTIPCITGPYSNVAAKLTLLDSRVRETPSVDDNAVFGVQIGRNSSISTSTANADPGVFELRFDAPKNPPFKGAGAESSWRLQFPERNRVFDYLTISDVVLELSYTADDDGLFRQVVEGTTEEPGSLDGQLQQGMTRIVSLRHEFPSEFQRLKASDPELSNSVELLLTRTLLFPHWIGDRPLVATLGIAIEPKSGQPISVSDIQGDAIITLNNQELSNWFDALDLGGIPMVSSDNELEVEDNSIELSLDTSFPDSLEFNDLLILINYTNS